MVLTIPGDRRPVASAACAANASRCSHAEPDESDELDHGDPVELARLYEELKPHLPGAGDRRLLWHRHSTHSQHLRPLADRALIWSRQVCRNGATRM